jgi:Domain of unknown function (DU1801)
MKEIENFYFEKEEPSKGCLLSLRKIILSQNDNISEVWKYGMPFFCFKGKMFCYLWFHKKHLQPYIGMVEGNRLDFPDLIIEKRSRMKIMLFDPNKDLPIQTIEAILQKAIGFYISGEIKTK